MMSVAAWPGLFGDDADWEEFFGALASRFPFKKISGEAGPCDVAIGYSLGGRKALHFAARGKVTRALVLVSSNPGIEKTNERAARKLADEALASQLIGGQTDKRAFLEKWWAQPVFASHRWTPTFRQKLFQRRQAADWSQAAQELAAWGQGEANFWPVVDTFQMPILAIAGAYDAKYIRLAEEIARRAPNGCHRMVPEAAHMVHLEQPVALAEAVSDFLAEILTEKA